MASTNCGIKRFDLSILWLVAGGLFLLFYLAGVWNLNEFEFDNWSYVNRDIWGLITGNLSKSVMLYFDPQQLSSFFWKAFFLFPGLICISIWLSSRLRFAQEFCSLFTRFLKARLCLFSSIVLCLIAILILIIFVARAKPLVDDEYAYVFQAQTYLMGHVAMPTPLAAKSFADMHMLVRPVWTGKYLFGHPVFLAIGTLLGSPYVASVAMSLVSLVFLFVLGIRTGNGQQAAIATWLLAVSPWFWFTSATLLSHTSTLMLFLVAAIGWTSLDKHPSSILAFLIGLCMGWSFSIRPLTALLLSIPFAFLALRNAFRDPKAWSKMVAALALGGLIIVGLVLLYDRAVTGNPFQMPFTLSWPGENIGFGEVFPVGHPIPIYHTPLKGIFNLAVSTIRANYWFLGWPVSFLPLIGLLALTHFGNQPNSEEGQRIAWTSWDTLWVAVICVFCIGYISYYSSGVSDTGPVYYYELLVPLTLLSAKGILAAHQLFTSSRFPHLKYFVPICCVVFTLGSVVFFVPEKALHNKKLSEFAYRPFELAEKQIQGKALVLVGPRPHIGWLHNRPQPSPKLDDRILFVRLLDNTANEEVLKAFPDRKAYRLLYRPEERRYIVEPYSSQ
jgi:hypothetical protein